MIFLWIESNKKGINNTSVILRLLANRMDMGGINGRFQTLDNIIDENKRENFRRIELASIQFYVCDNV